MCLCISFDNIDTWTDRPFKGFTANATEHPFLGARPDGTGDHEGGLVVVLAARDAANLTTITSCITIDIIITITMIMHITMHSNITITINSDIVPGRSAR